MISIKSDREIDLMRKAGEIVGQTHNYLEKYIKPGISTNELDQLAEKFIKNQNAIPSFKNYNGFPKAICISINDEVVHGIPSSRKLKEGDIVSIDIGACYQGYHGDSAWSYAVGEISDEKKYLLKHTERSLYKGLSIIKDGVRVGDIGNSIEKYAKENNLSVVKELVGHGIGMTVHEDPDVPNYGKEGSGPILKEGMTIAVEPMLNIGTAKVFILDDDWTIVTGDGKASAHFEHTVLITKDGYEILTKR
ncbi:MAG: type I methionyl aminopeptidase [Bacilli bacterium]|nr:type I methionyl aminopeptidase [Bacilli bacterium]